MYYADSHIHLQDYTSSEVKNVVTNALRNNVREFVVPSSNPCDWKNIIKITKRFSNVIGAIGIHPWCVEKTDISLLQTMEKYLQKHTDLWVGECGIDRAKDFDTQKQHDFFIHQIELAVKYNRPLIIHAVKADKDCSELFDLLPQRTVFHSFSGSIEWGQAIQRHGFYLGINFSFFKKDNSTQMLQKLDLNKILLETDAPYQPSKSYVSNLPENLPVLASGIAAVCGLSEIEFSALLSQNWKNFKQI